MPRINYTDSIDGEIPGKWKGVEDKSRTKHLPWQRRVILGKSFSSWGYQKPPREKETKGEKKTKKEREREERVKQEIGGNGRRAALSSRPLGGSRGNENSLHHFNVGSATFGQVVLGYIKKDRLQN